jgi:competence protein ComEC
MLFPFRGRAPVSFNQLNAAIARRPALPAAILFILGIAGHSLLPPNPIVQIIAIGVLLVAASLLFRQAMACSLAIGCAIALSGACAGQLAECYFPRNDIGAFAGDEPRLTWVEGDVRETPRMTEPPAEGRKVPDKQVIELDVRAVNTWSGWIPASGRMPVTISPPLEELAAGQRLRALGRIERPAPAMNPGGFDAASHYRRQRVLVSMHVSRPCDVQIISNPTRAGSLLTQLRERSRRLLDLGFTSSHSTDRALLRALVFGDREPAMMGVAEDFTRTGTTHLLASNGARIAVLAAAVYILCRLLRFPPRHQILVVTATIALFGMLTMPAAEAVRPAIVCAAIGLGLVGRRQVDSLQILAMAAVAILVLRPMDLYGAGFQLSFTIVCGMILFTGPVMRFVESFENKDRKVAESFQPPTRMRRLRRWLKRRLIETTAAGTVAWVVAMPLVAYHFEQFNPWTVPLGVILSPFALLALLSGFAKIALTALCPVLAGTWASVAAPAAILLRHLVHTMARLPGSDLPLPTPEVWQLLVFYGMLCLPLVPWPRWQLKWCARCAPFGACAMLVLLPLCGGLAPIGSSAPTLRITLLCVGAGQCAVAEPAGGGVVVFDAGSSTVADPLRTVIDPFLRHERCSAIDSIWLSHGDFDHISAVRQLVPEYTVHDVVTSPYFRSHAHESKPCDALLHMLDRTQHSPRLVLAGDRAHIGSDAEIEVLWPPAACAFNSNNTGVVFRLTCDGRSILFPADIQEPAERELLKHPEKLRSDILIAPHHGSDEVTTARFIHAVNPKVILASNDARLTMKQRVFDSEVAGTPLYRTSRCGAITLEVTRDGKVTVTPFLATSAPGFQIAGDR